MIRVEDISVNFGGVNALSKVSCDFTAPITGMIGPNGAGKTTLLNVFSGFVVPRTGSIMIDDVCLLSMLPHIRAQRGLRRTFQSEQVVEDLSIIENIRVMLDALSLSNSEKNEQIEVALEYVELTKRRHALGKELTNFERRMTEIAKALVGNPRFILFDEPGAGFRGKENDRLREIITGIPERFNSQVALIDHDVSLIRSVCENTVVLDFGYLIMEGPTEDVLKDPKVIAAYLGKEA